MRRRSRKPGKRGAEPTTTQAAAVPGLPLGVIGVVALVLAGLWSYGPSLGGQWLMNWDDNFMVVDNANLRQLDGLWKIWIAAPGYDYWPLTQTLLWLEWHLFGAEPFGYHIVSVALHITGGLLIWRLLERLGLRWGWAGGLIFVVHPLAAESIAWVSEVKNALSLPLFLLALLRYLDFDETGRQRYHVESLACFLLAMLSKSSVVMLPCVLALYCWWKHGTLTTTDLKRLLPFFAVAIVLGAVTVYMQTPTPLSILPTPRTPGEVWLTAARVIFFYLGSFLVPLQLEAVYPRWDLHSPTPLQLALWPLLVALLLLLWKQKTWGRHVLLGLGFFLLTLAPTLGFIHFTFMRISWVADHFAYLPMIGLIGLAVAAAERLHAAMPPAVRPAFILAGGAAALALALLTRGYAGEFRDERSLWEATIRRNPEAVPAYINLGIVALNAGNLHEAHDLLRKALVLRPTSFRGHCNLAGVLAAEGDKAGAMQQLIAARRINPNYPVIYFNMGTLCLQTGAVRQAVDDLQLAVSLDPHYADAQENLGYALCEEGQPQTAVDHFQAALADSPHNCNTHFFFGLDLMDLKRFGDAEREFTAALSINPHMAQAKAMLLKAEALEAGSSRPAGPPPASRFPAIQPGSRSRRRQLRR